ncbi:hypothetical protein [Acuticoccus mangrovi]|uniref:Uncharacterized protein n=1 Tax=Acuticoccus mangrovi TaxID=2796142 RepID=A0A934MBQ5_9HYPH|nr:hypothetical protein [Acuticoccus mangrovi]MBJ3774387.1 hypothetical protein [Acuticoccus mangrovi]
MSEETETIEKTAPDRALVKRVARTLSGLDMKSWQALSKDERKPHLGKAKKVLNTIDRFSKSGATSEE